MFKIFPLVVGLLLVIGCAKSDPDKPDSPVIVKKSTSVNSPSMNHEVTLGSSVSFEVGSNGAPIDSVIISGSDFSQTFTTSDFSWTPKTVRTGRFNFKLTVYCGSNAETHYPRLVMLSDIEPEQFTYQVVNSYPHDTDSFIQGLFFLGDDLIESTGQKGQSVIKKVNLETGVAIKTTPIGDQYFGEGSTYYNDEIFMVTWTSGTGFVFDTELNLSRNFQFSFEGWGLTTLGDSILMTHGQGTKGTNDIYFMNPSDFTDIDHLEVYDNEGEVSNLNEIEMIQGQIYVNEWQTDKIHVVETTTGRVLKTIDLSGLLSSGEQSSAGVLNGIAYHQESDRLFVTGKNWPKLFEIKLQPKNPT